MRKLACLSLSYKRAFSTGTTDLFQFIDTCRALDLDGIDLHSRSFASEERGYLLAVKYRCLRAGLPIACLGISNNFALPIEEQPAQVGMVKRWIDHALFLGAPQVRVFAGRTRDGDDRAAAWDRCVASLQEVADYGWHQGVQVALQNHNHGALTEYGSDVLKLVEQAGPHLGHVWDTGQYVGSPGASGADCEQGAQEVLYASLQQTVHLATHVRTKIYRIETGEERWLDYPRIFEILRRANYNGFCSIVYEGQEDEEPAIARAATYLRRFVP